MIEAWVAAGVAAAGAVIGGVASYEGARAQANASRAATNAQESMFNEQMANLAPYQQAGVGAIGQLDYLEGIGTPGKGQTAGSSTAGGFGSLNAPFTMKDFHNLSPQYNFNLQQGAQGTLNQSSSGEGAESGAALSSLEAYNQNYANNSFNSAFQNYQTQQNNIFNRLSGIANIGEGAAANTATGESQSAGNIGQSITNTGTAIGGGIAGAGQGIGNAALLGALMNGQQTTNSYPATGGGAPGQWEQNYNPVGPPAGQTYYSDYGLKKNIEPYRVMGHVPLYKFHYENDEDGSPKRIGVIAQEIAGEYPEAIGHGPQGYLTVDYSKIPTDELWHELDSISNGMIWMA
jgi:hypothetical protein